MKVKEGLDGSGRHSVYDQKGNVETHNMIMWMWVALEVYKDDQISNAYQAHTVVCGWKLGL